MTNLFPNYNRLPITLVRGDGTTLTDSTGKTYRDFGAGIGVMNLGYNYPPLVAAMHDQVDKIWHTSNIWQSPLQEAVAAKLVAGTDKVAFFANSGAEAVEAALKLARKVTGRHQIMTFKHGFHGRTYGALSVTPTPSYQAGFGVDPAVTVATYNDPAAFDQLDTTYAAVIVETVQGEGGLFTAETQWLQDLVAAAHAQGVLVIVDDVQAGIGRTGRLFSFEHADIDPDIVTLAKGLGNGMPIGAMLGRRAFGTAFQPGSHGTTFGGNPLAMVSAQVVLDTMTPTFLAEVAAKSDRVWAELTTGIAKLPVVTAVHGRGLMIGITLAEQISTGDVLAKLRERGVIALAAQHNTLRLLPPLVMTLEDLLAGLALITAVLVDVAAEKEESLT